jgi:hypothetical protein
VKQKQTQERMICVSRWDRGSLIEGALGAACALVLLGCGLATSHGLIVLSYVAAILLLLALPRFLPYRAIIIDPRQSRVLVRDRFWLCFKRTSGTYAMEDFVRVVLDWDHEPFRGWRFDAGLRRRRGYALNLRLASYVEDPNVQGAPVLRIRLQTADDGPGIELARFDAGKYLAARSLAERVVRMTTASFHDHSTSQTIVRNADQIDQSLGQRIAKGDVALPVVPRPLFPQVGCEKNASELRVTRKTHRLSYGTLITMLVLGGIVIPYLVWVLFQPQVFDPSKLRIRDFLHVPLLAACFVYGGCLARWLLLFVTAGETLLVTHDSLRAWCRRVGRGRLTTIPVSRLEELHWSRLGPSTGVLIARSDEEELRFAAGLTAVECAWIASEVLQYLFPSHVANAQLLVVEELPEAELVDACEDAAVLIARSVPVHGARRQSEEIEMKKPRIVNMPPVVAEVVKELPPPVAKRAPRRSWDRAIVWRMFGWIYLALLALLLFAAWSVVLERNEVTGHALGYVACAEVIVAMITGLVGSGISLLIWQFLWRSRIAVLLTNFGGMIALGCLIGALCAQDPSGAVVGGGIVLIGPLVCTCYLIFSEIPALCLATVPLAVTCMLGPFNRHWLGVMITSFGACLWCANCIPVLALFGILALSY